MRHVVHAAIVVLLGATAALCVSSDGGDVASLGAAQGGEPAAEGDATGSAKLLTPWDRQGLAVIKAYADYNKKLQNTERNLRDKLANPPDKVKGIQYHKIDGYKFAYLGKEMEDKSRSECELVCSSYSACLSYSYNAHTKVCVWSMGKVKYNFDVTMYVKKLSPEGDRTTLYNEIPGLQIQGRDDKMPRTTINDKFPLDWDEEPTTVNECKYSCTERKECKTFTFFYPKKQCKLSGRPVSYDPHWQYYEKEAPADGEEGWQKDQRQENDQKEELKAQWIQGSSAKSRAEAENAEKTKKAVEDSKSTLKIFEDRALRAKKAADMDDAKCQVAGAQLEGAVKRNTVLLAKVEESNDKVENTQQKRAEAQEQLQTSKTFEGSKKAELKLTLFDVQEVTAKATTVANDEKGEKKRKYQTVENKAKLCGAFDLSNSDYQKKEGLHKVAKAKEEYLSFGEIVAEALSEEKVAESTTATAESDERRQKMTVAMQKASVETANKKSEEATSEVSKKEAIQDQQKSEEKYHKGANQVDTLDHQLMVAKEKLEKAQEITRKKQEKEEKAEHNMKSKKREAAMKGEALRVNRKMKLQKENDEKSELQTKDLKSDELHTKKMDEKKEKDHAKIDELNKDEMDKKEYMQKNEKTFKEMKKSAESEKEGTEKHEQKLADLQKEEDDSKYKIRKDALTKRTLEENEADAKKTVQDSDQEAKDAADKTQADEQNEKAAAAALKKATTEADTKVLMRNELNAKQLLTTSSEFATKSEQHKMLAAEDLVQAQAKQQAEQCIHICEEGLEIKRQEAMGTGSGAGSGIVETQAFRELSTTTKLIEVGEGQREAAAVKPKRAATFATFKNHARSLLQSTEAEGKVADATGSAAADAAENKEKQDATPVVIPIPVIEPFTYNGCQC